MAGEKKHLSSVLASNGYPFSLVQKITKTRTAARRELLPRTIVHNNNENNENNKNNNNNNNNNNNEYSCGLPRKR